MSGKGAEKTGGCGDLPFPLLGRNLKVKVVAGKALEEVMSTT